MFRGKGKCAELEHRRGADRIRLTMFYLVPVSWPLMRYSVKTDPRAQILAGISNALPFSVPFVTYLHGLSRAPVYTSSIFNRSAVREMVCMMLHGRSRLFKCVRRGNGNSEGSDDGIVARRRFWGCWNPAGVYGREGFEGTLHVRRACIHLGKYSSWCGVKIVVF